MKLRVKEIAEALDADTSDILAICTILNLPVNSTISSLSIEQAKQITDYYESH
tara:strand:- start:79 stop:237 length:159 start_codon:yes stop_codon:yes gene_type:complete